MRFLNPKPLLFLLPLLWVSCQPEEGIVLRIDEQYNNPLELGKSSVVKQYHVYNSTTESEETHMDEFPDCYCRKVNDAYEIVLINSYDGYNGHIAVRLYISDTLQSADYIAATDFGPMHAVPFQKMDMEYRIVSDTVFGIIHDSDLEVVKLKTFNSKVSGEFKCRIFPANLSYSYGLMDTLRENSKQFREDYSPENPEVDSLGI